MSGKNNFINSLLPGLNLQCDISVNRLFVFPVGKQQQKGAFEHFYHP